MKSQFATGQFKRWLMWFVIGLGVSATASVLAQSLMVRSVRTHLHSVGALVSMSAAKAINLNGFKAGYQYLISTRNLLNRDQVSSYSLLLGSRTGTHIDAFSLSYTGTPQTFSADGFGQLYGFLARKCLGASSDVVSGTAQELARLSRLSFDTGKVQSINRVFGSFSMSLNNMRVTQSGMSFLVVLSTVNRPGMNGWKEVCGVLT
jgi:hypothetical protein